MKKTISGFLKVFNKLNGLRVGGIGKVVVTKYSICDRAAIQITSEYGEPYGTLTVNIPECPLQEEKGEILVKTWSENEHFSKKMMETGMFEDTGKRWGTGFVEAQIWRVKI